MLATILMEISTGDKYRALASSGPHSAQVLLCLGLYTWGTLSRSQVPETPNLGMARFKLWLGLEILVLTPGSA